MKETSKPQDPDGSRGRLTRSEGEEEAFVGVFLQQRSDASAHALVTLVDQLLSEVAVDLLRRHLLARRQRHVVEVRHLDANRTDIGPS